MPRLKIATFNVGWIVLAFGGHRPIGSRDRFQHRISGGHVGGVEHGQALTGTRNGANS